jgi:hypothetical protein
LAFLLQNGHHAGDSRGDKKIRPGRAHNGRAPDAVRREYRGEKRRRKGYFTRKFSAKSDWANPVNPTQKLSAVFDYGAIQTQAKSIAAFVLNY